MGERFIYKNLFSAVVYSKPQPQPTWWAEEGGPKRDHLADCGQIIRESDWCYKVSDVGLYIFLTKF